MNHLTELLPAAGNAFRNTYSDPEGTAGRYIRDFERELQTDLEGFATEADKAGKLDLVPGISERYITNYKKYLSAWLYSHANLASSFIVGPANFPVARMEKYRGWTDNHYQHFRDWRRRASNAIGKALQTVETPEQQLQAAKMKLQQLEARQQLMKDGNALIRKHRGEDTATLAQALQTLGVTPHEISYVLAGKWSSSGNFPVWMLTNNNANIKRMRERVQYLEKKHQQIGEAGLQLQFAGFRIEENRCIDRVLIIFDAKPCREICDLLRKKAFLYSPKNKANQRKLTPAALYDAKLLAPVFLRIMEKAVMPGLQIIKGQDYGNAA